MHFELCQRTRLLSLDLRASINGLHRQVCEIKSPTDITSFVTAVRLRGDLAANYHVTAIAILFDKSSSPASANRSISNWNRRSLAALHQVRPLSRVWSDNGKVGISQSFEKFWLRPRSLRQQQRWPDNTIARELDWFVLRRLDACNNNHGTNLVAAIEPPSARVAIDVGRASSESTTFKVELPKRIIL